MIPDSTAPAILLAGVIAGVLLAAAGLLGRSGRSRLAQVLAAFACGAGYLAGALWLEGKPSVPPVDVQQWLTLLAPAAVVVGVAAGTLPHAWARIAVLALYLVGAGALVCKPLLASWSTSEAVVSAAGFLALTLGASSTLSVAAERLLPRWAALATFAFAAGSSFLLLIAGSVKLGLLGGCVAATAGAAVAVSLAGLGLEKGRAVAGTVGALVALQWARSYFYGDLQPSAQATFVAAVVLLALVPLAALLGERFVTGKNPVKVVAVRVAFVVLPVALALGLAAATSPRFGPTSGAEAGF